MQSAYWQHCTELPSSWLRAATNAAAAAPSPECWFALRERPQSHKMQDRAGVLRGAAHGLPWMLRSSGVAEPLPSTPNSSSFRPCSDTPSACQPHSMQTVASVASAHLGGAQRPAAAQGVGDRLEHRLEPARGSRTGQPDKLGVQGRGRRAAHSRVELWRAGVAEVA